MDWGIASAGSGDMLSMGKLESLGANSREFNITRLTTYIIGRIIGRGSLWARGDCRLSGYLIASVLYLCRYSSIDADSFNGEMTRSSAFQPASTMFIPPKQSLTILI